MKGFDYERLHENQKAEACYARAIELVNRHDLGALANLYVSMARILSFQRRYSDAFRYIDKILDPDTGIRPTCASAWKLKALVAEHAGRHEDGLEAQHKAIQLAPSDPFGYYRRAAYWSSMEQYNNASHDIHTAIQLLSQPKDPTPNASTPQAAQATTPQTATPQTTIPQTATPQTATLQTATLQTATAQSDVKVKLESVPPKLESVPPKLEPVPEKLEPAPEKLEPVLVVGKNDSKAQPGNLRARGEDLLVVCFNLAARICLSMNDAVTADQYIDKLLVLDKDNAEGLLRRAECRAAQGNIEEALQWSERALNICQTRGGERPTSFHVGNLRKGKLARTKNNGWAAAETIERLWISTIEFRYQLFMRLYNENGDTLALMRIYDELETLNEGGWNLHKELNYCRFQMTAADIHPQKTNPSHAIASSSSAASDTQIPALMLL